MMSAVLECAQIVAIEHDHHFPRDLILYIVEIIPDALNVCFSWITNNK